MFTDIASAFLILVFIVVGVFTLLSLSRKKNVFPSFLKGKDKSALQFSQAAQGFPPQLIDRPIIGLEEGATITIEKEVSAEPKLEIADDEETVLLKAAEIVVEKVQDVVTHIASSPPNPEEVFTKIRAIVRDYKIFENTEYFDAINSFIAITVERDCNITFTKEELLELWK